MTFLIQLTPPKKQRRQFSTFEDEQLKNLVRQYGITDWGFISQKMGNRTPRQCRDRWREYLCPGIISTKWTPEEDDLLRAQVRAYGQKWSLIAPKMNGRSETNIKNRWRLLERRASLNQPILYNIQNPIDHSGVNEVMHHQLPISKSVPNSSIPNPPIVLIPSPSIQSKQNPPQTQNLSQQQLPNTIFSLQNDIHVSNPAPKPLPQYQNLTHFSPTTPRNQDLERFFQSLQL